MKAICLITFRPNKIWCDFLNLFSKYKIFIIVDDNDFELGDFMDNYENITFIKVENEKCKRTGYIDTNFTLGKLISGWDKALYYFGFENDTDNYDFIWFMEDDVFFNNEDTILRIDQQYTNDDLLSPFYLENSGDKNNWQWHRINIEYPQPHYRGMMCIVRFSKEMLDCINYYAYQNKTLCFLEALFPTIAIKNNLKYGIPVEFNRITWNETIEKEEINMNNLYHPVKDMNNHTYFREILKL